MKSIFKIMAVAGFALSVVSCGAANPYYGDNSTYPNGYPTNNGVYRAQDGTTYRTGEIYRDRNGNVYQNGRIIRTGDYGNVGVYRDNNYKNYPQNQRNLPPGQAKKIYGGEAKDYAPGQQKKYRNPGNGNWNDDDHKGKKHKKHKDNDRD